jgi:hypothetical protein
MPLRAGHDDAVAQFFRASFAWIARTAAVVSARTGADVVGHARSASKQRPRGCGAAEAFGTTLAVEKKNMRVLFSSLLVAAAALLVTACSGGADGATLQRGRSASSSRSPEATGASAPGAGGDANGSAGPPSTPAPAAPAAGSAPVDSDAGPGTQPAPAPAPSTAALGSCANPKCVGANGFGGCKATDGAGDVVTMGCQGGACGCFAGGQTTATFDGDVTSADDAAQLFLLNCTCN